FGDRRRNFPVFHFYTRGTDVLAGHHRHVDRETALRGRQPPHARRGAPLETEHEIALDFHVRRKLLHAGAGAGARARLAAVACARQRERLGEQAVVGEAGGVPPLALEQHTRRRERERERELVARGGEIELHAVHAAADRDPDAAVFAARDGVGRSAVELDGLERRRRGILRQRQRDAFSRVHLERDGNAVAIRAHFRLGDRGAGRGAFRRFGQALAQLLQERVRWIALRLRTRRVCEREREHGGRGATQRSTARAAAHEANDEPREQRRKQQ